MQLRHKTEDNRRSSDHTQGTKCRELVLPYTKTNMKKYMYIL